MSIPREIVRQRVQMGQKVDVEPISRRMKVYQLSDPVDRMIEKLKKVAYEEQCDKLLFYVKKEEKDALKGKRFIPEGYIDGFFQGEAAYIYSLFLDPKRNRPVDLKEEQRVMEVVKGNRKKAVKPSLPDGYTMQNAQAKDAPEMAELYQQVFETYPTPMNDPQFIREMMNNQVFFTVVKYHGCIVSACSTDILPLFNCAEISDCVTLPEHRNLRLLSHQFSYQVKQMKQKGVQTLFCYARAVSAGMNLINSRHGFTYGGRMVQNSNIAGRLESMNIWFKNLHE
ncbi:putative beta-lysine N-acetyltransferase [Melghirimyces algeriensis]|uniref:Beta-lysine acetyltransferase n=1 Tax=Melghirimyces algeriensis TaxID=910412 RepID=A0A521DX80_9BACL|nr:putative beta-lysine N-acetyltransferase [Melghirimyces algeriensis]SMO76255.1 beta-lysine acetyltransferase [Melghirimyces algeriensis]